MTTTEPTFTQAIAEVINRYSKENGSNTPDMLLAEYLIRCLEAFDVCSNRREAWYGVFNTPGQHHTIAGVKVAPNAFDIPGDPPLDLQP